MSRARDKIKRQARLLQAMLDMMYAGHRGPVFDAVERAYNRMRWVFSVYKDRMVCDHERLRDKRWSAMARKAAKGKRFCVPG